MAKTLAEMIAPTTADPDATLTALDVFEEKSQDADDAIEYGMGLSNEELFDIATSVTPMGSVGAGKGAISFLKGLLGRAKSKWKFPVGYGQPTKGMGEAEKEMLNKLFEQGRFKEVLSKIDKPKGMRQFGKFNRPLGKHGNKPK